MIRMMRKSAWCVGAALLVLLSFPATTWAETLLLKDGSKITGTITSETQTTIVVNTPYGTLNVDKSNVVSVDYGGTGSPSQTPASPTFQQQQQQQQQQTPGVSTGDYQRGQQEGDAKGYQDGEAKGRAEQKSARVTGSLVGWLCWIVVVVVVVLVASSSSGN